MISSPAPKMDPRAVVGPLQCSWRHKSTSFFALKAGSACALDKLLTSSINVTCCAERARGECAAALHIKVRCGIRKDKGHAKWRGENDDNYESGRKGACIAWGTREGTIRNCIAKQMKGSWGHAYSTCIRLTDQTQMATGNPPYASERSR